MADDSGRHVDYVEPNGATSLKKSRTLTSQVNFSICFGRGRRFGVEKFLDDVFQHLAIDWLWNVIVHSSCQTLLPLSSEYVGGHGDNWNTRVSVRQCPNSSGRFESIHVRHLTVYPDNVVVLLLHFLKGFPTVTG